jgi:hypothetical protein
LASHCGNLGSIPGQSCGICAGQSALDAGFIQVCPATSHSINCSSFINHPIIDAYVALVLAASLNNKLKKNIA